MSGLRGTDLNLLVALGALLEERNLTRAGERINMSQPAMSGALARLRRYFDDELLVRDGRKYQLTPLAQRLLPDVREALRQVERTLEARPEFDPATSTTPKATMTGTLPIPARPEPSTSTGSPARRPTSLITGTFHAIQSFAGTICSNCARRTNEKMPPPVHVQRE